MLWSTVLKISLSLCFILFSLCGCWFSKKQSDRKNMYPFSVDSDFLNQKGNSNIRWTEISYIPKGLFIQKSEEIKNKYVQLLSPSNDPYFGQSRVSSLCKNRPDPNLNIEKDYFIFHLPATDDSIYGMCDEKLDTLKSQFLLLTCHDQKQTYEIKFFYDKNLAWKLQPLAKCL
jgi:hypothetical protein